MATREREKAAKRAEARDNRPHASARNIRIPAQKVRIVIDLIRGKDINEAIAILANTPKSASPIVMKVLKSAIANAEHNLSMSTDKLYVQEVYANDGLIMKRFMPRAKGSAAGIQKRTCHITVVLNERK